MKKNKAVLALFIILVYASALSMAFIKYHEYKDWEFKKMNAAPVYTDQLKWGLNRILTSGKSLAIKGYVYDSKIGLFSKRPSSKIVLLNTNTGIYYALDTQILPAEDDNGTDKYKVNNNRYCWVSATLPLSYLSKYKGTYKVILNYAVDDISLFVDTGNYIKR